MVGINERGSRRYVLMIIASYLSDPSTGGSKLMEIIYDLNLYLRGWWNYYSISSAIACFVLLTVGS